MGLSEHAARSLLRQIARHPWARFLRRQASGAPSLRLRYAPADVADALYRGILDRAPDQNGLRNLTDHLECGTPIDTVARSLLASSEFTLTMMKQRISVPSNSTSTSAPSPRWWRRTATSTSTRRCSAPTTCSAKCSAPTSRSGSTPARKSTGGASTATRRAGRCTGTWCGASPAWWEQQFAAKGLVRERAVERAIHARLEPFFADNPARKCLFVLKHEGNTRDVQAVIDGINAALDQVPDL